MKNLKKVLSLVLALAMALSLMTVAFAKDAKDFADYDKVSNNEAMDVMVALGVFEGSDGNLNPTGELTREQAAKIITYMLLGKDAADKLVATTAPYADVAATRWSAGSIAYCTEQGIIAGSNGKFDPTGKLTGQQFAKMLLCALGYDAKQEGLVGGAWAINASSLAVKAGLDENLGALSTVMTREQAAQMAFNAEKATLVDYTGGIDVTTGDGTNVKVDANRYNVGSATETVANSYANVATPYTQFCEQYAKKLKLTKSGADTMGHMANVWYNAGVKVGSYAEEASIVYTENLNTTDGKKAIKADLKDYTNYDKTAALLADGTTNVQTYVNGKNANANTQLNTIAGLTGNGRVVEIYVEDNYITRIAVTDTVLAKVKSINKTTEEVTYTAQFGGTTGDFAATTTGYGKVAKDDYVLLTMSTTTVGGALTTLANNTIQTVAPATKVTGIATTKNTANGTITVAGTAYEEAATVLTASDVSNFGVSPKYDATLYLDSYGYILKAVGGASATSDKAVAVLKSYQSLNKDGALVYMIQGVTSNGETVNWEYESVGGSAVNSGNLASADTVYTYADGDDDDSVELTAASGGALNTDAATVAMGSVAVTATQKSMTKGGNTAYFDSNVKFIFVNNGKAVVRDGVQKYNSANTFVTVKQNAADSKFYITAVYVLAAAPSSAAATGDVVFVAGKTGTTAVTNSKTEKVETFTTYDAYINGEKVDNFYAADNAVSGFYYAKVDADNGAYVLSGNAYAATEGKMAVKEDMTVTAYAGNVITCGTVDFDLTNATIVNKKTGVDIVSAEDIYNNRTATNVSVMYDEATNEVSYIYVMPVVSVTMGAASVTNGTVTYKINGTSATAATAYKLNANDVVTITITKTSDMNAVVTLSGLTTTATGLDSITATKTITATVNGNADATIAVADHA